MKFRNLLQRALAQLGFIRQPDFSVRRVLTHPSVDAIQPGQMILVGRAKNLKWACFHCPGQCGEVILLSLVAKQHPRWTVSTDWLGRPTVQPSIRQLNECGCHFWIQQGSVSWCSDSRSQN